MDLNVVKKNNRSVILNVLRDRGCLSRKDIADITGLSPGAVTTISNEMLSEGALIEVGTASGNGRAGRKKILLDINKKHRFIIGINIEKENTIISISNLSLEMLTTTRIKTNSRTDPERFLEEIVEESKSLLWKLDISKSSVLGIGVGIAGKVDSVNGVSEYAYGVWNKSVKVREILEALYNIPVVVENNVRGLALAEVNCSKERNLKNFIFIKHGPGIGAAIIIDKKLLYGANNMAGEIGHIIVNVDGYECSCGQRGCLETTISSKRIISQVRKWFSKEKTPRIYQNCNGASEKVDIDTIFKTYFMESDDSITYTQHEDEIRELIEEVIFYLALGIVNLIKMIDPENLVFYGEIFKYKKLMGLLNDKIETLLRSSGLKSQLHTSCLEFTSPSIGGLSIALEHLFFETGAIYKT